MSRRNYFESRACSEKELPLEEVYRLTPGIYKGTIIYSRNFIAKNGQEWFLIKIRVKDTQTVFVYFIRCPHMDTHPVIAELLYLIDNEFDVTYENIVEEEVDFAVAWEIGEPYEPLRSEITWFHIANTGLPFKEEVGVQC